MNKFQSRKVIESYIESVLNGKRIAGKHQKYAVQRYTEDVGSGYSRGLYFDEKSADWACNFFPVFCRHTMGGQFANKPFTLEPWQAFCTWNIFGWRKQSDSLRRFKKAYITVAAKSGKSTWMGGMALLLALADCPMEPRAHIYICSSKMEQSRLVFDESTNFLSQPQNEFLDNTYTIYKTSPRKIEFDNGSKIAIVAVGAKLDGINAHAIIRDELHAFTESYREGCEKLSSRMLARQQPLMIDITTAGDDKATIWKEEDSYAARVVEAGALMQPLDDTYFSFIARMDEGDDPFSEQSWHKANPSLGVTVPVSTIAEEANRAKNDGTKRIEFLRYKCNVQTSASSVAILPEQWEKGSKPTCHAEWEPGYGGCDLARTRDLASISAMFPVRNNDGGIERYEVISKSWTCSQNEGIRLDREPFRSWIANGKLNVIEGDMILYEEIQEEIERWTNIYNVQQWAFDPHRAMEFITKLEAKGVNCYKFFQSPGMYNEACEKLPELASQGKIVHGGDPVLAWQIGNLEYIKPKNRGDGLVMPNKRNAASKIDAACATLMAFQGCLFAENQALNFYDNNNVEMG